MRRCRAAAAPDRLGFHLAQAVGVALQWSSPQVRIVVPVPSQNFIRSRNLGHYRPKCGPKQDRNFNSLFGRENSLFFAENSLFTPKNFPACSTGRSNFVTAWLYQSSRAIGISHIRHNQAIGPDDTRQRIDGLNAVHVYLSKHSPRSETSLRTCGRRLLASPCPSSRVGNVGLTKVVVLMFM